MTLLVRATALYVRLRIVIAGLATPAGVLRLFKQDDKRLLVAQIS